MRALRILQPLKAAGSWTVLPIHYSHDPAKTREWAAQAKAAYPNEADWDREMEIDFSALTGVRAYPKFTRPLHLRRAADIVYNPMLPLCLCIDFNVGFMSWPVAQIVNNEPVAITEITLEPADIPSMARAFRNRFPAHPAELWIFGDASGHARSVQSQQSNYDLLRLALSDYSAPIVMMVPEVNPPIHTRLNSVNTKLMTPAGKPGCVISDACLNLIADFEEVLLDPKGHGVVKVSDPRHPYFKRTHSSDGWGYMCAREWPIVEELFRTETKPEKMPELVYGRLAGDL